MIPDGAGPGNPAVRVRGLLVAAVRTAVHEQPPDDALISDACSECGCPALTARRRGSILAPVLRATPPSHIQKALRRLGISGLGGIELRQDE
jgi:hypothetical protein